MKILFGDLENKCNILSQIITIYVHLLNRQYPRRHERALLHGPIRAGAPKAACSQSPAVCWPLLPSRQLHLEERSWRASVGPRCCHSGSGPTRSPCHWPWQNCHGKGPSKEASANGRSLFFLFFNNFICVCFVMYIVVRNAFFWSLTTLWAKLKITNRVICSLPIDILFYWTNFKPT